MLVCTGLVKGQVILAEDGVQLPEGAAVAVWVLKRPLPQLELCARLRVYRIRRPVGMAEIVEDDTREREAHPETWLTPKPALEWT